MEIGPGEQEIADTGGHKNGVHKSVDTLQAKNLLYVYIIEEQIDSL